MLCKCLLLLLLFLTISSSSSSKNYPPAVFDNGLLQPSLCLLLGLRWLNQEWRPDSSHSDFLSREFIWPLHIVSVSIELSGQVGVWEGHFVVCVQVSQPTRRDENEGAEREREQRYLVDPEGGRQRVRMV